MEGCLWRGQALARLENFERGWENPRLLATQLVLPMRADDLPRSDACWHALDLWSPEPNCQRKFCCEIAYLQPLAFLPNQQIVLLRHLGSKTAFACYPTCLSGADCTWAEHYPACLVQGFLLESQPSLATDPRNLVLVLGWAGLPRCKAGTPLVSQRPGPAEIFWGAAALSALAAWGRLSPLQHPQLQPPRPLLLPSKHQRSLCVCAEREPWHSRTSPCCWQAADAPARLTGIMLLCLVKLKVDLSSFLGVFLPQCLCCMF